MINLLDLYPHNKIVFNKVLENLKTHNKVGVVQATGTGKGKLAACFIELVLLKKRGAKIVIFAPLQSVLQNYRDNFELSGHQIDYVTYTKLNHIKTEDIIKIGETYDLIILDEFHRLGAPEWGKNISNLFIGVDKGSCKVIGLTATPIRYLDNSRDMGVELFDGNIIEGVNLETAIIDGILPGFDYHVCYYKPETVLNEISKKIYNKEKISNELLGRVKTLKMSFNNRFSIETIIKDGTKNLGVNQKWVIFCKDKENLDEIKRVCPVWFTDLPNIFVLSSSIESAENDRVLKKFREVKDGINVLLCIDMLNEGVHIKDVNGVIMLRKTDSPILFLQQLGRALEVGKEFKPIIFDLIGNYRGLKADTGNANGRVDFISMVTNIEKKTKNKKNYIIVHNYVEDIDKVFDELSSLTITHNYWSPEELEILAKYYPKGGPPLCIEKGLNRPPNLIKGKANKMGIFRDDYYWTPEEYEILRKYYPLGGSRLCIEQGLNKTRDKINQRAAAVGLHYDNFHWSDEDKEILLKYYPLGGSKLCQEKGLNKSISTIGSMARKLKIYTNKENYWTEEEINILKKYFQKGGAPLCREHGLLRKDARQIASKASNMGLYKDKKYTEDIKDIVRQYYPLGGTKLCQENGLDFLTPGEIRVVARGLNVHLDNMGVWEDSELEILKKYYPIGGYSLCKEKGLEYRKKDSIQRKAKKLGLTVQTPRWSQEEISILMQYYPIGGAELCQKQGLDRSITSIKAYMDKLNRENK